MLKDVLKLTRLENLNLYGLNRLKYTTDKQEKRRIYLLFGAWIFVILVLLGYMGGYAYGLHYLGLTHAIPALFSSMVSLVLLVFGIFSASSNLFRKSGYDFLSALPIHPFSIVLSRMIRMYIEDLLLSFFVTLPAVCIYAYFAAPSFLFYPAWIAALIFMPIIPMSLSILFGALISLFSSVFRKMTFVQTLVTVIFAAGLSYGSSYLSKMGDELSMEAIKSITELVLKSLEKTYLPAAWIGGIAVEKYAGLLPLAAISIFIASVTSVITGKIFPFVVARSTVRSARKAFHADKNVKSTSVMTALLKREFKRYFASGIYLMNTIISPVMAVAAAIMFMASGIESVVTMLPFDLNFPLIAAYLIGVVCSLMPPSAVSLSMEGKTWWLLKTLPVRPKHLLGAKILMSVLLHAPFLLAASVLTVVTFAPNAVYGIIMFITPFVLDAFACTWALFINLKFPRFDWENEVYVVKQSAAAGVGGLTAPIISIAGAIPVAVIGTVWAHALSLTAFVIAGCVLLKIIFNTKLISL